VWKTPLFSFPEGGNNKLNMFIIIKISGDILGGVEFLLWIYYEAAGC
jgi:hypothetical protein